MVFGAADVEFFISEMPVGVICLLSTYAHCRWYRKYDDEEEIEEGGQEVACASAFNFS